MFHSLPACLTLSLMAVRCYSINSRRMENAIFRCKIELWSMVNRQLMGRPAGYLKSDSGILGIIAAFFLSRSVINTANRFIYPFASVISRGLGVPLTQVTSVIAVNQATSLIGLFTSQIGDRAGYRRMMIMGLLLLVAGMLLAASVPFYLTLVMAMFLCGLGKTFFDPAIQAYVGTRVSYRRRGMMVGGIEISWSMATLVGIPLIGILINRFGWRSPFFVMAGAGLLCMALIIFFVKDDSGERRAKTRNKGVRPGFFEVLKNRRVLGAALFTFLASFANDNLFVIYGVWLEQSFDLSVVALGLGTGVIGIAELCGSTFTAAFSDRIGLKSTVFTGVALCSMAYLSLPLAGSHLSSALAALFVVFLFFEMFIVAFLSMGTELLPGARATMMSVCYAAGGLGRVAGAFLGGFVWNRLGMEAVSAISAGFSIIALIVIVWATKGWQPGD